MIADQLFGAKLQHKPELKEMSFNNLRQFGANLEGYSKDFELLENCNLVEQTVAKADLEVQAKGKVSDQD